MNSRSNPPDPLSRRRELLESEGLRYGAADAQSLFWARYNLQRSHRFRRPVSSVGALTGTLLKFGTSADAERMGRAIHAWNRVAPVNCRGNSRIDGLRKGRLTVLVDSKSTAYVLRRQAYRALLEAMEDAAPGLGIEEIVFRVGRIARPGT